MTHRMTPLLVCWLVVAMTLTPLMAKERKKSGNVSGSKGRSTSFEKSVNRQSDGTKREVSKKTNWTNAKGGQGSHSSEREWDKESKTGTVSKSTTRADGKTASTDVSISKTGEDNIHVEGTRTGFNGETSTFEKDITKTGDGTASISSTVTRADGSTVSTSSQVTKTENGRAITGSYETSTGKSGEYNKSVTHEDNTRVAESSVTNQDGQTATKTVVTTRTGDTLEHTANGTNFNGKTWSRSGSTTIDE